MADRRSYAGPHDAAALLITDSTYATVLRNDLNDTDAVKLGYTTDPDTDPAEGLVFAHRSIVVSDELAAQMPTSVFPRVGGEVDDADAIDDPASNPVTSLLVREGVELETVEQVHERQKAERLAELDAAIARFDEANAGRAEAIAELHDVIERGKVGDGENERALTDDERAEFEARIESYRNASERDAAERDDIVKARTTLAGEGA